MSQIVGLADLAARPAIQKDQKDAESLRAATGHWSIVISSDKSLELAGKWQDSVQKLGYSPAQIYLRDGFYSVTAGSYPTRQLAEQAAIALRPLVRADSYVVAIGRWCSSATAIHEPTPNIPSATGRNSFQVNHVYPNVDA